MSLRTVHKKPLAIKDGVQFIYASPNATLLSVEFDGSGAPRLFVLTEPDGPQVPHPVQMFTTGRPIDADVVLLKHLGTAQLHGGMIAYHFFEVSP